MSQRRPSRPPSAASVTALLFLLASCGGDSGTGPSGGNEDPVTSVTVSPPSATVTVGGEVQFTATARNASGNVVSASPNWSVLPSSLASVTTGGLVRGLAAGEATVTATVSGQMGSASLTVEAPPSPPAAPSGLTATPTSSSAVVLEWEDNSDDESGFRIERAAASSGPWSSLTEVASDVTSHTDSGLAEGVQYFYRVAALGDGTVSDWSNVADATTLSGTEAAVAAVEEVIREALPPEGTPAEDRNLLDEVRAVGTALSSLPEVDTTIVLERVLAVETLLMDGTMHLFINNQPTDGEGPAVPPPPGLSTQPASYPSAPSGVSGPPGSAKAVVTSHDGGAEQATKVRELLTNAGYEILPLGASLADMRQYQNLGVLHLDTHGVSYNRLWRDEDGTVNEEKTFALQTSTEAGRDLSAYSTELNDGLLAIATNVDGSGQIRTKIAVTEKFIARYWSFDDGVVMMHACHGGSGPFATDDGNGPVVDPSILRLAILGAGARIVVAFDNLTWGTYAEPSMLHFFDRLLGANSYDKEEPPLRPFDVDQVQADMDDRGLLQFTRPDMTYLFGWIEEGGNTVNVIFDKLPGRTTLAPSIRNIDVVDDAAQAMGMLTLNGLFGSQQGTVEVEGVPVSVESWSEETIVARAPYLGGGSAGPVVVKKPNDVKSNEVPLTEWRGTVKVSTETVGSLKSEATIDLRFRADVHAFRNSITDDPEHREVTTYISPATNGSNAGSGSYSDSGATETWFGTYPLQMLPKQAVDTGVFPLTSSVMGGTVRLDPDAGTAEICLGIWGKIGIRVETSEGTYESTGVATFMVPSVVDRMKGFFGCVDADLDDDNFVISSGDRSGAEGNVEFKLQWTDFQPFTAPDEDTAG